MWNLIGEDHLRILRLKNQLCVKWLCVCVWWGWGGGGGGNVQRRPLFSTYNSLLPLFFFVCVFSSYFFKKQSRSFMQWVVGSILHGVDPLSYFSFQPVLHDWCNKGRGMCYPVCGMVHIKEPLLLIGKSSLCGGSRFPFSLSEWSLTICPTPYNRK